MTPAKRRFYLRFMFCACLWFFAEPIGSAIALGMSEWTRHKNASMVLFILIHSALAALVYVLSPGPAQHYFVMTVHKDELDGLMTGGRRSPRGEDRGGDGNGGHGDDGFLGGGSEVAQVRARISMGSGHVELDPRDMEDAYGVDRGEEPFGTTPEPVRRGPAREEVELQVRRPHGTAAQSTGSRDGETPDGPSEPPAAQATAGSASAPTWIERREGAEMHQNPRDGML